MLCKSREHWLSSSLSHSCCILNQKIWFTCHTVTSEEPTLSPVPSLQLLKLIQWAQTQDGSRVNNLLTHSLNGICSVITVLMASVASQSLPLTTFNICLMAGLLTGLLLNLIKERNEPFAQKQQQQHQPSSVWAAWWSHVKFLMTFFRVWIKKYSKIGKEKEQT